MANVGVANVTRLHVSVELRLELRAGVGLQDVDAKRQAAQDFVDALNRLR